MAADAENFRLFVRPPGPSARVRRPRLKDALREIVVLSAFLASAGHIYQVAVAMGNSEPIAAVHAIGVDGLVYIGIGAFRDGAQVRGGLAVVYGGVVSLAFNYAAYTKTQHLPPWIIAASMPIVLVLAVLVSMSGGQAQPVPARPEQARTHRPRRIEQEQAPGQAPKIERPPRPLVAPEPPPLSSGAGARRGRRANPALELAVKRVLAGEQAAAVAAELGLGARNVQIAVKKARDAITRGDISAREIAEREIPPTDAPVPKGGGLE